MPREHPLAPHRVALVLIVLTLAAVAAMWLRGPSWWRKNYYPVEHAALIEDASERWGVDPYLVTAVINSESGFDAGIVSDAGAVGLMQVMPETAQEIGEDAGFEGERLDDEALKDPGVNIAVGTCYLSSLLEHYEFETEQGVATAAALAAYNAGVTHADDWLGVAMSRSDSGPLADKLQEEITYPETSTFVERVLRSRREYARLYPDLFG